MINVLGDALGTGVVDRLYHGKCNFQPRDTAESAIELDGSKA